MSQQNVQLAKRGVDFRDGKLSRVLTYLDHGEGLRAAGLSG
jgi:hypothetical protein